jgi:PEGA domain
MRPLNVPFKHRRLFIYEEDIMIRSFIPTTVLVLGLGLILGIHMPLLAANDIMGEIQFVGASKVEKTSGVWVDGQYVGYLKELKGSKKVVVLPGQHEIAVKQAGYHDFTQKVILEPGQKHVIQVAMQKNPAAQYPEATAQIKMSVSPNRAAVFLDDQFVGHVDEFDGPGQALLLAPGKHRVKITLPGYRTFETELNLLAEQKFELKTELFKGSILQAGPLMNEKDSDVARAK